MPKAPVNEDNCGESGEHDVRRPGQIASVKSKSEAQRMCKLADATFGRRVGPWYCTHYSASNRVDVHGNAQRAIATKLEYYAESIYRRFPLAGRAPHFLSVVRVHLS